MTSKKVTLAMQRHILSFVKTTPGVTPEEQFIKEIAMIYNRVAHTTTWEDILNERFHSNIHDAVREWMQNGNGLQIGPEVSEFLTNELGMKSKGVDKDWKVYKKLFIEESSRMFNRFAKNAGETLSGNTKTVAVTNVYSRRPGSKTVSRSEREIALTPSQRLDRLGYDLVDARVVGRDPEMLYVEYIVTGRSRRDGSCTVWTGFDWTSHPNPGDRSRGFAVQSGAYGLSRAEAAEEAADRFRRHSKAHWEPVSGSRTVLPYRGGYVPLPNSYSKAKAPARKPASKPKPKTVSKTAKPKSQTSRKTTSRTKGARR